MKKKPKRRKYACLNRARKKKKEKQIRRIKWTTKLIRNNSSYGFFGKDLDKIKWPTLEETLNKMHQKYTHKEYEDLFLGHFIHQDEEDNDDERKI